VGILNAMRLNTAPVVDNYVPTVTAAVLPYTPPSYGSIPVPFDSNGFITVTREQAMSVPAVARARNVLAGTLGTIPLEEYNSQGQEIKKRQVIDQPDPAVPRAVTLTWLAEDLLLYGVGYLQVMDVSPLDGRPFRMRRINPTRISYNLSIDRSIIESYNIDGNQLPNDGLGSLIVFQGWDEGVLSRAGRTIQTAIELESAAYRMAAEPVPQMVLNNEGMNLDGDSVAKLLASFRQARRDRSTAYTEGPIKLQTLGFDSAQMQLVEARQYAANEIARLMGIPAWYLNAESANFTYSNVSSERRTLVDFGLRPLLGCIEDRLSMDDVTPRGQYVKFDLDDFLRGNPAEQTDIAIKLTQAGIITVDEAREMVDYAPSTAIAPSGGSDESA